MRAMDEKAKFAELLAEESFQMKRQIAENGTERLKVQEMVAKAKARAKVFEESESRDGKLFPQTEEASIVFSNLQLLGMIMSKNC